MINVLVFSLDDNGVGYYRINAPYLTINDPEINIEFVTSGNHNFSLDENNIKRFNVIVFHKAIPVQEHFIPHFMSIIKKYNIKLIFDIDDYWILHETHINYKQWKQSNDKDKIIDVIKNADYVTTTTPIFADEIKELNKNVIVIENAINHIEQQWIPKKIESDKTRFIWGGGITHKHDLALMSDSINSFDKDLRNKIQLYLCGYDLRVSSPNGIYVDDISRNTWSHFELMFTNSWKWVTNNTYAAWLKKYDDNGKLNYGYNEQFKDEFYQRRWTKPIFTYGTMYNEADVALAPLKANSKFNLVKSQLKVIEAGIHKCPIIASDFGAYTLDVINGKHGFLIPENDKKGWYDKIKYFSENPNAVKDMGMTLNELVLEKYTLDKINIKRIELIKKAVE